METKFNTEERFNRFFLEMMDDGMKDYLGERGAALFKFAFCCGSIQLFHFAVEKVAKLGSNKTRKFLLSLLNELQDDLTKAGEIATNKKFTQNPKSKPN